MRISSSVLTAAFILMQLLVCVLAAIASIASIKRLEKRVGKEKARPVMVGVAIMSLVLFFVCLYLSVW